MVFLEWTNKFVLNVKEIDEQHEFLFNLLNRLYDSVVEGAEQGTLDVILTELIDYTVYHFNTEEDLFNKHKYPDLDNHKKEHNDLTNQVVNLQSKFKEGSATISFEVLDFLKDWLVVHTMDSDQKFTSYIANLPPEN